ncbi:gamma-glutamyltransferase [Paeniroseomonas aquatica]|uniref:Gamma-glutamyltransferase n=1 Tax=Paeniroseomonas aquatica TaxID=373043 RepID=A0ABT8A0N1_9PROT|nr:gamma-glutamyltransferase [Paeniroseomonas aquatica]MDN3563256.1 gamma-glutamyltransferase [Paeniroseomonas aquatica]
MPLQPMVSGRRHMVSAGHWLATEAGHAILEAGGNAVDAAAAAGIALGVLHPDQVQFAGVAPMIIHLRERGETVSIAGLGWWPRAADIGLIEREHDGHIPEGILRTVIPAAPDAWILALERYGTMSFGEVAAAAIRHAREGFCVHPVMAHFIGTFAESYRRWPQNAAIFLPGGAPPREGDLFVQEDLARSLQYMADEERAAAGGGRLAGLAAARAAFYEGDLAAAMARFHAENGGWLTREDLAGYRSVVEAPVRRMVAGTEIHACGPWSQGPVLLQFLAMLEGIDLRSLGHNSAAYVHLLTEVIKLGFADRDRFYGDPRFVDVPLAALLSPAYAAAQRARIDPARAAPGVPETARDFPWDAGDPALVGDTSYVCAVDRWGNAVSATPSDTSWDSPVIPGLGFVPSSRGSQSWGRRDHASSLAPGKRPRLTPNPALAIRQGEWVMPFGGPGGDLQPQAMLQVYLNHAAFGMSLQEAVEAPRFVTHSFPGSFEPHACHPGRLDLEEPIGEEAGEVLAALGHAIQWRPPLSLNTAGVMAISRREDGLLQGGADPRRAARVMGI